MARPTPTLRIKKRNDLQEWSRFLQAESHTLRLQPRFFFQQAANQPDSTAPATAAKERSAKGLEKRPWFRWVNKRQEITDCVFAPGSCQFATTALDGDMILWNAENGALVRKFPGPGDSMSTCAFSPHYPWIAGITPEGVVKIWEINSGREVGEMFSGKSEQPNSWDAASLVFSPDGLRILFLHRQRQLSPGGAVLWDVEAGQEIGRVKSVEICVYLPDGARIIGFDASVSRIFNANDLTEQLRLEEAYINFSDWEIFPDGRRIVCGYGSGDVLLLEPQNIKFSAPAATVWERPKPRWNPLGKEKYAILCLVCGQWSELPSFFPGEEMDCPKCNQRLALNPFTISGDWRELGNAEKHG